MEFVTPWLAVGSRRDADDPQALAEAGIDTLVSLAPLARPAGIARQLSVDLPDRMALDPSLVDEVVDFVRERVAGGARVMIHCEMGISRSPAIAACLLVEIAGRSLDAALAEVARARPLAMPHPVLLDSLRLRYAAGPAPAELSGNENPLGPSPRALAALRHALDELHRYPDRDCRALVTRLAERLQVAPAQVVLGNGACELIDLSVRACLADGGEMLLPEPSFPAYRSAAQRAGAAVTTVPMAAGRHDVDAMIAAFGPRTRLVIVASPHNPTGSLIAPADWARLLAALPPRAWLLLDEAYRDYAPDGEALDPLPGLRRGDRVIVLRSLSKVHGLAGLRFGYGLAPAEMASRLARLCPQYHIGRLAQAAALAALDDEAHVARSVAANAREREVLHAALARMGVDFIPSAANFVVLRAPRDACVRLEAAGVRVKDMARYGMPGHVRVSVGTAAENLRFVAALGRLQREDTTAGVLQPA